MSLMMMQPPVAVVPTVVVDPETPAIAVAFQFSTGLLQRGGSITRTIPIDRSGGYMGAVTAAMSSLPTGVTAVFAENPTTGDSFLLTLNAAADAPTIDADTITLTATGSGVEAVTANMNLTVFVPGELITLESYALKVAIGPQIPVGSVDAMAAGYDAAIAGIDANTTPTAWMNQLIAHGNNQWSPGTGTISLTNNSDAAVGNGTAWVSQFPTYGGNTRDAWFIRILDGEGNRLGYYWLVYGVSNTAGTLTKSCNQGAYRAWDGATGTYAFEYFTSDDAFDGILTTNYYDRIGTFYRYAYRLRESDETAANALFALCDEAAELWWQFPTCAEGLYFGEPETGDSWPFTPRTMSMEGMVISALRSHPERIEWLSRFARGMFGTWVWMRRAYDYVDYDMRDPGYCMAFLAMMVAADTDVTRRAGLVTKLVEGLQYPVGSMSADGLWLIGPAFDADRVFSARVSQGLTGVQMSVGLMTAYDAIRLDPTLAATYATELELIKDTIVASCDGWKNWHFLDADDFTIPWDGARYFASATGATATTYNSNPSKVGVAVQDFGFDAAGVEPNGYATTPYAPEVHNGEISVSRQSGVMLAAPLAFASAVTGDPSYLAVADKLFSAGHIGANGTYAQGYLYDATDTGNSGKFINETHRRASEYLVYRQGIIGYPAA